MWLLIAFIIVPMIEIALFIQVGGLIGVWWTLLIVLATAIAGSYLVRTQGSREFAKLQRSFSDMQDPTEPLANGAMILFAGALLLTPGFFTDIAGLSLLVPGIRRKAFLWLRSRMNINTASPGSHHPQHPRDRVIDAEFEDVTPDKKPTHRPSGWTQH
ncbi:FxsA family protein [Yoonia sp.]|uniref:FxsA family protein n=1 Tax=Yoonia sp. TaxID=2212373 RepID=UPI0019F93DA6|nr:FxsA family protein [Yoonia sp.]MBE0413871.1 FxsA family protein [Yoonia sp.]